MTHGGRLTIATAKVVEYLEKNGEMICGYKKKLYLCKNLYFIYYESYY